MNLNNDYSVATIPAPSMRSEPIAVQEEEGRCIERFEFRPSPPRQDALNTQRRQLLLTHKKSQSVVFGRSITKQNATSESIQDQTRRQLLRSTQSQSAPCLFVSRDASNVQHKKAQLPENESLSRLNHVYEENLKYNEERSSSSCIPKESIVSDRKAPPAPSLNIKKSPPTPCTPPPRRRRVELLPGQYVDMVGSAETWQNYVEGNVVSTLCYECQIDLVVVSFATLVVCPTCQQVSPVLISCEGPSLLGLGMEL